MDAGIPTAEGFLGQGRTPHGREAIAEATGISGKLILGWINPVDPFRVKGIGDEYSHLLEIAGVDTVLELARRNPPNPYQALQEINAEKKLVRQRPSQHQVSDWIEQAQRLPRVIEYWAGSRLPARP